VVCGLDAAIVLVWLALGLAASGSLERSMTAGLALLAALPLGVLFLILFFASRRGSRAGLWICLALGAAPPILLASMIA
jgi:hypothetical protein